MTDEKRLPVSYFDRETLEIIHRILSSRWEMEGEPIPPFLTASEGNLDALVKIPQSRYFGVEQYPTLESKAAIIFYTLNKKHLFLNGNKRMSVACLSIFLILNNYQLTATDQEMTDKAIWLAMTSHDHDFDEIKNNLVLWIRERMAPIS